MTTGRPTAESADAGTPSAAYEKPLKESLEDASVLLWYATREGKQVSEKALSDIVQAQSTLSAGDRNPEVEGRFWVAFRELATAVQPASVDSILATYSYPFGDYSRSGKRRLTDAAATKKKYSVASLAVLGVLIFVQIYWFIGNTWRGDLEAHRTELDRIAGSLREMSLKVQASEDLMLIKDQQIAVNGEFPVLSNIKNTRSLIEEQLDLLKERQSRTELEYANVTLRGDRVEKMLYGNFRMLDWWDFVTELVPDKKDRMAFLESQDDGASGSAATSVASDGHDTFINQIIKKAKSLERQQLDVEDALVNSKSMLAILSQYFLPLLYGLLGALAYILRTLSREIQNVTFTRGSEIRYSLRWPLGMLGGVTVGLFFDPADLSGLAVITPLGLAFLAGYGVELLFTGLDRMVSAFTGEGIERPKAA